MMFARKVGMRVHISVPPFQNRNKDNVCEEVIYGDIKTFQGDFSEVWTTEFGMLRFFRDKSGNLTMYENRNAYCKAKNDRLQEKLEKDAEEAKKHIRCNGMVDRASLDDVIYEEMRKRKAFLRDRGVNMAGFDDRFVNVFYETYKSVEDRLTKHKRPEVGDSVVIYNPAGVDSKVYTGKVKSVSMEVEMDLGKGVIAVNFHDGKSDNLEMYKSAEDMREARDLELRLDAVKSKITSDTLSYDDVKSIYYLLFGDSEPV